MEQQALKYPISIFIKEGNGNIEQLNLNIIEHSIDYKKLTFTYTDESFQLGFIPLDNILRMVFGKELFEIRNTPDEKMEGKNIPKPSSNPLA